MITRKLTSLLSLNLRQKMIGCLCLHLIFYIIAGVTFIKYFKMFNDDVTLLMHAGNLNTISFKIRCYEKNFIISHDSKIFSRAIKYIEEAQQFIPRVINGLEIMPPPKHLEILSVKLKAYKENFQGLQRECTSEKDFIDCPLREKVHALGQDIVTITGNLVQFEQDQMTTFIENLTGQLVKAILFLVILTIFTITILYISIIKPLKMVENAAIDIAKGTFSQLPVDKKKGEVRSVLRAFNKMVTDLEEQQEQLFQAKKLSSIGTLASGTAHQINNPLNNIATSCQLALAEIGDDKESLVVKMLETIDQETQRAAEIVRGLLEFSRAQTFSPHLWQLAKIVSKMQLLVGSEVPAGISINTEIPENIPLYIDGQKMIDALLNLTINAIQAIPSPPGTIVIKAEKDMDKKNAVISVTDTGTGIPKEHLQKIFDPFFTTKNAENGTGLGLAVVYGIIKKQNGAIKVESVMGKGTRFIITLPLYPETKTTDQSSGKDSINKETNV